MTRASSILAIGLLATIVGPALAQGPANPEAEARAAEVSALNPLSSLDKATLDGFRDAPLFTPSRTRPSPPPPEPEAVAEAPPPAPEPAEEPLADPPTIKLAGIVEGPDGAVAYVSKDGETEIEQLRLGDQIDGWLVSTIDPAALKLTLDEREQEYRLFLPPNPSSASSDDDDDSDASSNGAAPPSSSNEPDDDDDQTPRKAQQAGSEREEEAARKAQKDAQKRQRLNPDPQQQ